MAAGEGEGAEVYVVRGEDGAEGEREVGEVGVHKAYGFIRMHLYWSVLHSMVRCRF